MTQAESARAFYDRISGVYDALADASEQEARRTGLRLLAPAGAERVLEIGCGTGHAITDIARALDDGGRVYAVDVSPKMLAVAESHVAAAGVEERVAELRLADAKDLPYGDDAFDAAFASFTLELFSEAERAFVLAEIARVLRPGGRLAAVSMHDDGRRTPMVDLYKFLHRHFPHIVDCQPIGAQAALEDAGFTVTASERLSIWGLPVLALVATSRQAV